MRSSGWGTTRAMRSCAKPIESWLSSKQVGLEFSSPPHPSWLASRCLRHRVHLLSTQLHLCRVRSHHPVQAYSTLRLLSGTTRISKKTRSRLKSPPRSLGSWVTPTRCSSAGDRERLQPHVPSPGCRPEHPGPQAFVPNLRPRASQVLQNPTKRQAYNDVISLLWEIAEDRPERRPSAPTQAFF